MAISNFSLSYGFMFARSKWSSFFFGIIKDILLSIFNVLRAVSYTHLDVYKRQQLSPFVKFSVTTAVTSWPVCVTPSATTPLSAHMMTRAFFSISISGSAWIPAIRTIFLSKTPRLPSGFATWLQRSWARAMAPGSGVMCKCLSLIHI